MRWRERARERRRSIAESRKIVVAALGEERMRLRSAGSRSASASAIEQSAARKGEFAPPPPKESVREQIAAAKGNIVCARFGVRITALASRIASAAIRLYQRTSSVALREANRPPSHRSHRRAMRQISHPRRTTFALMLTGILATAGAASATPQAADQAARPPQETIMSNVVTPNDGTQSRRARRGVNAVIDWNAIADTALFVRQSRRGCRAGGRHGAGGRLRCGERDRAHP